MAGQGARAHAERFLAACPEDVRAAALASRYTDLRKGELFWDAAGPITRCTAIDVISDGTVFWYPAGKTDVRVTHIDRLLGGA